MDRRDARLGHLHPVRAALAVGVGGLVGTTLRYLLGLGHPTPAGAWPAMTLGINLAGAFALGLLLEALARSGPDTGTRSRVRLGVGTGVLGSFTTYSTLAMDVVHQIQAGHALAAATYAAVSLVGGLVAAGIGVACGTRAEHVRAESP